MAIQADLARQDQPVLAGAVTMHIVTAQARIFAAVHDHIASVPVDVSVPPIKIAIASSALAKSTWKS